MKKRIIEANLDTFQELSIELINRKMDEVELKRLHHLIEYDPSFWEKLRELIKSVIKQSTDELKSDWSGFDLGHKEYSLEELYGWSKEKSPIENFQDNIMQSFAMLYTEQASEALKKRDLGER